ncbi:MAG TPA: helicase HerA-like domain-containing protein [Usitatibacteraceae bacterium]|nr:helicase HerA-like domain-containing protein [Usitatibacteraceae bacterium]
MAEPLLIAKTSDKSHADLFLLPQMANRHGLIAGATGTGKTISLQVLAENFSALGVPVFMADVKGDLTGISQPGKPNPKVEERVKLLGLDHQPAAFPATLWDVFGEQGHPVRATVSEMGPVLLARIFNLNETQAGVLNLAFKIADDQGLLLLDLKDLRALLSYVGENAAQFTTDYGNVSSASIGAIQRGLLALESQGGDKFFGEPALSFDDLMQTVDGKGVINILAADKLLSSPRLYSTFLLWMLSELFENLPEVGDRDKPKLVFFFDEAHLLFNEAPRELLDKIEQVVRLVRSKGVGVYFVTQNPLDIPDTVLGQLGNRIQHALRAYTPRDQKAVTAAAETFRENPKIKVVDVITELGVGEALVSFLDEKGRPTVVERALVCPPRSQIGPIGPEQRKALLEGSLVAGQYEKTVDRESAFEKLKGRRGDAASPSADGESGLGGILGKIGLPGGGGSSKREGVVEAAVKSAARAMASEAGRRIIRGVLGSILGGRR